MLLSLGLDLAAHRAVALAQTLARKSYLGVDFAADEDGCAGQVEPEHKDDDCAERTVGGAVRVEDGDHRDLHSFPTRRSSYLANPYAILARAQFYVSPSNAEGFPNALDGDT